MNWGSFKGYAWGGGGLGCLSQFWHVQFVNFFLLFRAGTKGGYNSRSVSCFAFRYLRVRVIDWLIQRRWVRGRGYAMKRPGGEGGQTRLASWERVTDTHNGILHNFLQKYWYINDLCVTNKTNKVCSPWCRCRCRGRSLKERRIRKAKKVRGGEMREWCGKQQNQRSGV